MRLSTKGEYGLLAIMDLALHSSEGPIQSQQIAERQEIPKQYLDQLMLTLKKAGFVESSRGRQGGYMLGRSARTITVFDVVTALEGPLENINFLSRSSKTRNGTREILNDLWRELFKAVVKSLQAKTIEALCDEHKKMQNQIMYYI